MILRILTDTNYLDIELKEKIDTKTLMTALDSMCTLMVETKRNTQVFINPVNVVAIEIIDTPPISSEK